MANDCGCSKRIVDKIYQENSCCNKGTTKQNCNLSCKSCGKDIDLIDSDLYAANVYNYLDNSNFNSNLVILLEADLKNVNDVVTILKVYEILETTNLKSKVFILVHKVNGFYGLRCVATLRRLLETELTSKYVITYLKLYKDESILEGYPIVNKLYVYTTNGQVATYEEFDITGCSELEVLNILNNYVTIENLTEEVTTIINNMDLGGDCLFEEVDLSEDYDDDDISEELRFSTKRKGDESEIGDYAVQAFAMQGGKALSNYSVAMQKGTAKKQFSIALSEGKTDALYGLSLLKGENTSGDYSSALSEGKINNSDYSIAISKGNVYNSDYSFSFGENSFSGRRNNNNTTDDQLYLRTTIEGSETSSNNISLNGGNASGKYSVALGSGNGTYCSATNKGSLAIGYKIYCGGFYASSFGVDCEIGRYRKLVTADDIHYTQEYVYGTNSNERGNGSALFGRYNSIFGSFNFGAGEYLFIKGSHNALFGKGNLTGDSSYGNLLYGHRNRVETGMSNISGGIFSNILSTEGMSVGSVCLGDSLKIKNIYLRYDSMVNIDGTYYSRYILFLNTTTPIFADTVLGQNILNSNIKATRNGNKKYLGQVTFKDYSEVYPSINTLETFNSSGRYVIFITLEDDTATSSNGVSKIRLDLSDLSNTYQCDIKFSSYGNSLSGSGSVSLGTYNKVEKDNAIAIGTGNKIIDSDTCTIGNFNNPNTDAQYRNYKVLFSVGNGYYSSNNLTINRLNAFEIIVDDLHKVKDICFTIEDRKYSMKDLISNIRSSEINTSIESLMSTSDNNITLNNNLNYRDITDTIVYDPNNVLPLGDN